MLCFLDRTFCGSKIHHPDCNEQLTPELVEQGIKWWGSKNFPVAYSDFCKTGMDEELFKPK